MQKSITLYKLIFLLLFPMLISACSQEMSVNKNNDATIVLVAPKHKLSQSDSHEAVSESIPGEITSINVELRDSTERTVFERDILKVEGLVSINIEAGKEYQGSANAFAGEELLFSTEFAVEPLGKGETRSVPISLQSQVAITLDGTEGFASASSVFQVILGDKSGVKVPVSITGLKNTNVIWYVNGIEGGNEELGTIDKDGVYVPPTSLPENAIVTITAEPESAPSFAVNKLVEIVAPLVQPQGDVTPPTTTVLPEAGEYFEYQFVTLSCEDCVKIYYSVDGSEPTESSQVYDSPFFITQDTTLKYFGVDAAGNVETTKIAKYVLQSPLDIPTGFVLTATTNSIGASWDDMSGVLYHLSISSEPIAVITGDSAGATSDTTYTILFDDKQLPLESGTQYYVALRAAQFIGGKLVYSFPVEFSISTEALEISSLSFTSSTLENCVKFSGAQFVHELTTLNCEGMEIGDLGGIQVLTSLTNLALSDNILSDISFIAPLRRLTNLWLASNQINSVVPLAALTNLEGLELGNNNIGEITSLSTLTKLNWLSLSGNGLEGIDGIETMTQLEELWLDGNFISDLQPLSTLHSLVGVELSGNIVSDVSVFEDINQLQWLALLDNEIMDITPLSRLNQIQDLWLSTNQIVDVSPLFGLTTPEYIDLNANPDLSCNGVGYLDTLMDAADGASSGVVNWSTCTVLPLAFSFDTGTKYGWTISGISGTTEATYGYVYPNPLNLLFDDYLNYNDLILGDDMGSLLLDTPAFQVPPTFPVSATQWLVDVFSPDLTHEPEWQNISDLSFRVQSSRSANTAIDIQILIEVTKISTGEELSIVEKNPDGSYRFHSIPSGGGWQQIFTDYQVDFSAYDIHNVKIRVFGNQFGGYLNINIDDVTLIPPASEGGGA